MISTDEFKMISELDLDPIKAKLMHESGEGWSLEKANAVEVEYRRFLYLMKKFPNEETAPLVDVDTFWHYHILDTMKYAADCELAFGHFLHHFPYVGMRGAEDEVAREQAGDRMRHLYETTFGVSFGFAAPAATTDGRTMRQAWCGVSKPDSVSAAWCGVSTSAKGTTDAWRAVLRKATDATLAWCGVAKPDGEHLAWCGVAPRQAGGELAWCGVSSTTRLAWCGIAAPGADAGLAWCGVSSAKKLAWCGVGANSAGARLAWCGISSGSKSHAAHCGACPAPAEHAEIPQRPSLANA